MAELKELPPRDNGETVRLLEQALERAKKGETTGVVLVEEQATCIKTNTTRLKNRFETMGYLIEAMMRVRD